MNTPINCIVALAFVFSTAANANSILCTDSKLLEKFSTPINSNQYSIHAVPNSPLLLLYGSDFRVYNTKTKKTLWSIKIPNWGSLDFLEVLPKFDQIIFRTALQGPTQIRSLSTGELIAEIPYSRYPFKYVPKYRGCKDNCDTSLESMVKVQSIERQDQTKKLVEQDLYFYDPARKKLVKTTLPGLPLRGVNLGTMVSEPIINSNGITISFAYLKKTNSMNNLYSVHLKEINLVTGSQVDRKLEAALEIDLEDNEVFPQHVVELNLTPKLLHIHFSLRLDSYNPPPYDRIPKYNLDSLLNIQTDTVVFERGQVPEGFRLLSDSMAFAFVEESSGYRTFNLFSVTPFKKISPINFNYFAMRDYFSSLPEGFAVGGVVKNTDLGDKVEHTFFNINDSLTTGIDSGFNQEDNIQYISLENPGQVLAVNYRLPNQHRKALALYEPSNNRMLWATHIEISGKKIEEINFLRDDAVNSQFIILIKTKEDWQSGSHILGIDRSTGKTKWRTFVPNFQAQDHTRIFAPSILKGIADPRPNPTLTIQLKPEMYMGSLYSVLATKGTTAFIDFRPLGSKHLVHTSWSSKIGDQKTVHIMNRTTGKSVLSFSEKDPISQNFNSGSTADTIETLNDKIYFMDTAGSLIERKCTL